jgi:hypothetical protein
MSLAQWPFQATLAFLSFKYSTMVWDLPLKEEITGLNSCFVKQSPLVSNNFYISSIIDEIILKRGQKRI